MADSPEEPRLDTRPVVLYPDPVLRRKALPVRAVDDTIRALVEEMFRLMDQEDGAGLAAPQIGESLRIFVTGASDRNWASYGTQVQLPEGDSVNMRKLMTDPQTSGGLLVACAPESAAAVLDIFRAKGFAQAAVIGHLEAGTSAVKVK